MKAGGGGDPTSVLIMLPALERKPPQTPARRRFTLFPRLRASADLLMMPKEVLADRDIRAEVVPTLSLPRISALLNRFKPDDFAPDPLPMGTSRPPCHESPPIPCPWALALHFSWCKLLQSMVDGKSLPQTQNTNQELRVQTPLFCQTDMNLADPGG